MRKKKPTERSSLEVERRALLEERLRDNLDYSRHDPKGWCGDPSRGAALGRPTIKDEPREEPIDLYVSMVRLKDGYDRNGTYFGVGEPLWWCSNEEGTVDFVLRAGSLTKVSAEILNEFPKATVRFRGAVR